MVPLLNVSDSALFQRLERTFIPRTPPTKRMLLFAPTDSPTKEPSSSNSNKSSNSHSRAMLQLQTAQPLDHPPQRAAPPPPPLLVHVSDVQDYYCHVLRCTITTRLLCYPSYCDPPVRIRDVLYNTSVSLLSANPSSYSLVHPDDGISCDRKRFFHGMVGKGCIQHGDGLVSIDGVGMFDLNAVANWELRLFDPHRGAYVALLRRQRSGNATKVVVKVGV